MMPNNTYNKTFRGHERRIENVVQRAITAQVISLSVKEICEAARISRQTFYAHYSSINDVQKLQEQRLQTDFKKRIGIITKREVIFTIVLSFVKDNSRYFSSVAGRHDFRMLTWMIDYIRPRLVPDGTTEYSYYQYRSVLKCLIRIWILVDKHAKQYMPFYVNELLRTRVMRSRLDDAMSLAKSSIKSA